MVFVLFCFYNIIVVCNSYKFIFLIKYYVLLVPCTCSNDISKHCLHLKKKIKRELEVELESS